MNKLAGFLTVTLLILTGLSATAVADEINISLDGGAFNIADDATVTKIINGISPNRRFGKITIQAKWHSDTLIPFDFRKVKVELINPRGSVVAGETGYSRHSPSDKTPKVDFEYQIKDSDANASGDWRIKVSNNSGLRIKDFNIRKGGDILSPDFASTLFFPCPSTVSLSFFQIDIRELTIGPNDRIEEPILPVGRGDSYKFHIKAKWHSDTLIPGDFRKLTVVLIKPNGEEAAFEDGYSQHAPGDKTPKIDFEYNATATDTASLGVREIGTWKVRVINRTDMKIKGFNIWRLGDLLVPEFRSTVVFPCN